MDLPNRNISPPRKDVKTRICMISDTHNNPPYPSSLTQFAYREPLPKCDILLHAGDITKVGYKYEHESMFEMLAAAPATLKIVIAGNHDINLDGEYYHQLGRRQYGYRHTNEDADTAAIQELWTGEKARNAGILYLEEGLHHLRVKTGAIARSVSSLSPPVAVEQVSSNTTTIAGTTDNAAPPPQPPVIEEEVQFTIYASPYTPEFCGWAFAYPLDQDRFNPSVPTSSTTCNSGDILDSMTSTPQAPNPVAPFPHVDIMLTHGPPYGMRDHVIRWREHKKLVSVGCKHLLRAVTRARPRLHVFGHIHEGFGAERHDWTKANPTATAQNVNEAVTPIEQDAETVVSQGYCYYDASGDGKQPLQFGDETIFVNAAVVTVGYEALNAPWIIDLDLPSVG